MRPMQHRLASTRDRRGYMPSLPLTDSVESGATPAYRRAPSPPRQKRRSGQQNRAKCERAPPADRIEQRASKSRPRVMASWMIATHQAAAGLRILRKGPCSTTGPRPPAQACSQPPAQKKHGTDGTELAEADDAHGNDCHEGGMRTR